MDRQSPAVAFSATPRRAMKPAEIKARLQAAGLTQASLARHLDMDPSAFSRLLRGERRIQADEAAAINEFFAVRSATAARNEWVHGQGGIATGVPVYGYAAAGNGERIAMASDQIIELAITPMIGGNAPDFGVRVSGESMAPRLLPGETVYVRRGLAPARNKDVVVELTDGTALVKTYLRARDGYVYFQQWNPEQEVRLAWDQIAAMHAVILRD
jgi:phage repressor protein C with HTH and peptisase S24 domain